MDMFVRHGIYLNLHICQICHISQIWKTNMSYLTRKIFFLSEKYTRKISIFVYISTAKIFHIWQIYWQIFEKYLTNISWCFDWWNNKYCLRWLIDWLIDSEYVAIQKEFLQVVKVHLQVEAKRAAFRHSHNNSPSRFNNSPSHSDNCHLYQLLSISTNRYSLYNSS